MTTGSHTISIATRTRTRTRTTRKPQTCTRTALISVTTRTVAWPLPFSTKSATCRMRILSCSRRLEAMLLLLFRLERSIRPFKLRLWRLLHRLHHHRRRHLPLPWTLMQLHQRLRARAAALPARAPAWQAMARFLHLPHPPPRAARMPWVTHRHQPQAVHRPLDRLRPRPLLPALPDMVWLLAAQQAL